MAKAPFTRVRINYCTDITLHGSTLRLHETGGTGRIFERQVRDLIFFRSQICTLSRSKILPIPPVPCKRRVEPGTFLSFQKFVRTRVNGASVQVWDLLFQVLKVLANEDTLLRTRCCRHKCFPVCPRAQHLLRTQFCVRDTKNVSDFVQNHFVSATNVSQCARARKRHEQQCFRNNVSSFATALILHTRPF